MRPNGRLFFETAVILFSQAGMLIVICAVGAYCSQNPAKAFDKAAWFLPLVLLNCGTILFILTTPVFFDDLRAGFIATAASVTKAWHSVPWKKILMVCIVICVLAFVWPTPYRYEHAGNRLMRINRVTGNARNVYP